MLHNLHGTGYFLLMKYFSYDFKKATLKCCHISTMSHTSFNESSIFIYCKKNVNIVRPLRTGQYPTQVLSRSLMAILLRLTMQNVSIRTMQDLHVSVRVVSPTNAQDVGSTSRQ